MSSITLYRDEATGVEAEWRKGGTFVVFTQVGAFATSLHHYPTKEKAVAAAKRRAKRIAKAAHPPGRAVNLINF